MLPCEVCFRALLIRFENTCVSRFSSVISVTSRCGLVHVIFTESGQRNRNSCCSPWHSWFRSVLAFLMLISPASTLDRSRISLMRLSRRALLVSIISMYFWRSSGESVSAIMREKPSMAFSGVRISWLMFARNNDFMRLAFSACFVFSSYSFSLRVASSNWLLA